MRGLTPPPPGRGVASGNRLLKTATPQPTIRAEGDARFAQVQARIAEWQPDALVVGGGFPEVYAPELSANTRLRADVAERIGREERGVS